MQWAIALGLLFWLVVCFDFCFLGGFLCLFLVVVGFVCFCFCFFVVVFFFFFWGGGVAGLLVYYVFSLQIPEDCM